jgi:hypothetical protein
MSHRPLTNTSSLKITAAYSVEVVSRVVRVIVNNSQNLLPSPLKRIGFRGESSLAYEASLGPTSVPRSLEST